MKFVTSKLRRENYIDERRSSTKGAMKVNVSNNEKLVFS